MTLRHLVKSLVSGPSKDPGSYNPNAGYPAPGLYVPPGQSGPATDGYNYGQSNTYQQPLAPSGYAPGAAPAHNIPPPPSGTFSPPPGQYGHVDHSQSGYAPPNTAPPSGHYPPPPSSVPPSQTFPPASAPPAPQQSYPPPPDNSYGAPPPTPGFAPPPPAYSSAPPYQSTPAPHDNNQWGTPQDQQHNQYGNQYNAPPPAHDTQFNQTQQTHYDYNSQNAAPAPYTSPPEQQQQHQYPPPPTEQHNQYHNQYPSTAYPPHDPNAQATHNYNAPDHQQSFPQQNTTYDYSQQQHPPAQPFSPPAHHDTFNMNSVSQALPDHSQQQQQFGLPQNQGTFPVDHNQQYGPPQTQNTFPAQPHSSSAPPIGGPPSHQSTFNVSPLTPQNSFPVHSTSPTPLQSPPASHGTFPTDQSTQNHGGYHSGYGGDQQQQQQNPGGYGAPPQRHDSVYSNVSNISSVPSRQDSVWSNATTVPNRTDSMYSTATTVPSRQDSVYSQYNNYQQQQQPLQQQQGQYPQYPQSSSPQNMGSAYVPPPQQPAQPAKPAYKPATYVPDQTKISDGVTVSEKSKKESAASAARRDSLIGIGKLEKEKSRTPSPTPPKSTSPLPYPTGEEAVEAEFPNPASPTVSNHNAKLGAKKPNPNPPYPLSGPAVNPPYPAGNTALKSKAGTAISAGAAPMARTKSADEPLPPAPTPTQEIRKAPTSAELSSRWTSMPPPQRANSITVDSTPIFVGSEPGSAKFSQSQGLRSPLSPSNASPSCGSCGSFLTNSNSPTAEYARLLDAIFTYLDGNVAPKDKGSLTPEKLGVCLQMLGYRDEENYYKILRSISQRASLPQPGKFINASLTHVYELYSYPFQTNINTTEPELSRDGFHSLMLFDTLIDPVRQMRRLNTLLRTGKVYDFKGEKVVKEIREDEGKLAGKGDRAALDADVNKRRMLRGEVEGELRAQLPAGGHGVEVVLPGDERG